MAINGSNVNTGLWLDPKGLESLRNQARQDTSEGLKSAAQQFEAQFLQMMLKSMRATVPEGGLFSGKDEKFYRGMMDKQLALSLASNNSIGLSESIVRQMGSTDSSDGSVVDSADNLTTSQAVSPFSMVDEAQATYAVPERSALISRTMAALDRDARIAADATPALAAGRVETGETYADPANRQEAFVNEVMPYARQAGRILGVEPKVLVAQAALETGWGQHVIRHPDGRSTFNYFNIKSGGSWNGSSAVVSTIEYSDGVARRQRDRFRAYDNPQESFADYVRLIQTQSRYAPALERAGDARAYLQGLERGGYATDPNYAGKILGLLDHPAISRAEFKNAATQPIQVIETAGPAGPG